MVTSVTIALLCWLCIINTALFSCTISLSFRLYYSQTKPRFLFLPGLLLLIRLELCFKEEEEMIDWMKDNHERKKYLTNFKERQNKGGWTKFPAFTITVQNKKVFLYECFYPHNKDLAWRAISKQFLSISWECLKCTLRGYSGPCGFSI